MLNTNDWFNGRIHLFGKSAVGYTNYVAVYALNNNDVWCIEGNWVFTSDTNLSDFYTGYYCLFRDWKAVAIVSYAQYSPQNLFLDAISVVP